MAAVAAAGAARRDEPRAPGPRLARRPARAAARSVLPGAPDRAAGRAQSGARRGDRGAAAAGRGERVLRHADARGPRARACRGGGRAGGTAVAGGAAGGAEGGRARGARGGSGARGRGRRRPAAAVRPGAGGRRGRARSADRDDGGLRGGGGAGADPVGGCGAVSGHQAGVRRGMVRDIEETTRSIAAALRDAERMAGGRVSGVTCGIAGEHVSARTSPGVVAVSREEISAEDVARVNEVARAISLGRDQELLHDIPQEYVVDQQRGISDPVGMTGTRLEVEMYLVTVQSTAAQNLRKAVQRAGYRVLDLVLEPLAASYAVLTEDEKELGVALLEIGGGSTGVTIFHEGKIRHLASLKYAGAQVTTDVVQVLGVTQADAERLKERHGVAYKPLVDPSEMITLPSTPGQGARQAAREMLSDIIHQRLDEIFHLVDREFEKAGYGGGRLPAGVVLTGGTAHLPGMVELARDVFAMPVRAGAPEQGISGLVDSVQAPRYAVPVGLVLYAARKVAQGVAPGGSLVQSPGVERWFAPLKRWLQDFF